MTAAGVRKWLEFIHGIKEVQRECKKQSTELEIFELMENYNKNDILFSNCRTVLV